MFKYPAIHLLGSARHSESIVYRPLFAVISKKHVLLSIMYNFLWRSERNCNFPSESLFLRCDAAEKFLSKAQSCGIACGAIN